jgi:hypothetical protein
MAVRALAFLAADEVRMARFFALTGTDPATIRAAAESPDFLLAVLDHVCADEALLLGLAEATGVAPETIVTAHDLLGSRDARG